MLLAEPVRAEPAADLLVRRDHQLQLAAPRPPAAAAQRQGRRHLGGDLPLHVERAAAAHPAVRDVTRPGVEGPLIGIGPDGVDVAEVGERGPIGSPVEACDQVGSTGLGREKLALEAGCGQRAAQELLDRAPRCRVD